MKTLVIYDSQFGNTERIAKAIAGAISTSDEVKVQRVDEASPSELAAVDLLIVGSPTQGGRPTPAIQKLLGEIPAHALNHTGVAAFDTRISAQEQGFGLRMLLRLIGYAAGRIEAGLETKGGSAAAEAAGFIVEGREGPLKSGEMERAANWAIHALQQRRQTLPA